MEASPATRVATRPRAESAGSARGAAAWSSPDRSRSTPATGNFVYLGSDAGDFIGGGPTFLITTPNAPINLTATDGRVSVSAGGWFGVFQTMNTLTQMKAGYYAGLLRYPIHNPTKGGLAWTGNGRGCNRISGWFAADRVTYANGVLTALELRFEQHCERGPAALRGKIRWSK